MSLDGRSLPAAVRGENSNSTTKKQCSFPKRASQMGRLNVAATWHAGYHDDRSERFLPDIRGTQAAAPVRGSSSWLMQRQQELACAESLADVTREEKNLRSTIAGTEYEKRNAMMWRHQGALSKLRRYNVMAHAQTAAEEQLRYATAVQLYTELGVRVRSESVAREIIVNEERQVRSQIVSQLEIAELQQEARQFAEEQARAEALFAAMDEVRAMQMSQMERHYRAPKLVGNTIQATVASVLLGEPKEEEEEGRERPPEYLLSYAVNEEEFAARQELRYEEMLERLPFDHLHEVACDIGVEEAAERDALFQLCSMGACQARLSAVLKIQSWWRLARQQSWASRAREAMSTAVRSVRNARTAADWERRLRIMNKRPVSIHAEDEAGALRDQLHNVEVAATSSTRYQMELDYYLFTLTEKARSFLECARHDLILRASVQRDIDNDEVAACSAQREEDVKYLFSRPTVPHRVFFLTSQQHLSHYPQWRRNRWRGGSVRCIAALSAAVEEEAAARALLYQRRAQGVDDLSVFAAAVRSNAFERLFLCVKHLEEEEASERQLVEVEASEADGVLQLVWCETAAKIEAALRPLLLLREEEAKKRSAIADDEEQQASEVLLESHWRWARLGEYRMRLAKRYTTTRGWRLASRGGGVGSKFVSLDTVANIMQRFVRRRLPWLRAQGARETDAQRRQREHVANLVECDARTRKFTQMLSQQLADLADEVDAEQTASRNAALEAAAYADQRFDWDPDEDVKIKAAVTEFRTWFDLEEEQPRDLYYKEVLARFQCQYADFFHGLNCLLLFYREGRHRIENDEANDRHNMQDRLAYRAALSHTVACSEQRARRFVEAEEADWRDQLSTDCAVASAVVRWGVAAKAINPYSAAPAAAAVPRNAAPVPRLSPLERLVSRESVCRTSIVRAAVRGLTGYLLDYSLAFRMCIADSEAAELRIVCTNADRLFDRQTEPIAQLSLIRAEETCARAAIASEATAMSYASPLIRSHYMLMKETLWPQFLFGHLTLSSNGAYMDRRLVVLLTQRVGHMAAKLNDLVQLEESARRRISYLEELTRDLRFVHKKLIL